MSASKTPRRAVGVAPVASAVPPGSVSPPVAGPGPHSSSLLKSEAPQAAARTKTPAGSAHAAADALPAGSRTYTIALPPGLKLLSLNGREHWTERGRRTKALKNAAWAVARQAKIPRLERVSVAVEYQPPDRRRRDAENTCAASGKAAIDGIVAAGVLPDDECPRYVESITCVIGEQYPGGRLVLHLTEIAATGSDAA